jgi:hypothetical protein
MKNNQENEKNKRTQIWSCKINHLIIKKLVNKIL